MSSGANPARRGVRPIPFLALRIVGWLVVALGLTPSLVAHVYSLPAFHDEIYFFSHEEQARRTIVEYGQLPLWNPYNCGGIVGVGNPQDTSLAPDFLLRVLFGTAPGRKFAILLFAVLAMEGIYRLARRHGASALAAAPCAIVFAVSGRFRNAIEHGHLNFLLFALMPWALLFFERALSPRRAHFAAGVAGAGACVGWMILCGGTYTTPYTIQVLGVAAVYWWGRILLSRDRELARVSPWRPWLALFSIGGVAAVLSLGRLIPMARVVIGLPRDVVRTEQVSPVFLYEALLQPRGEHHVGDGYVGVTILAFALIALLSGDRAGRWFGGAALLFFATALGEQAPYAPYSLMRHFPVYEQLRDPYRYVVVVAMFACLGAARGLTLVERLPVVLYERVRRRWRHGAPADPVLRGVAVAVGLLAVPAAVAVGGPELRESQGMEPDAVFVTPVPARSSQSFRQSRGNRWDQHVWGMQNIGTLGCLEETAFPQSASLRADLEAEEYPLDPDAATVRRAGWSPEEIRLEVRASRATRVLVNQNFHANWSASAGEVRSHDGLLAVDVPAGEHTVTLTYRDVPASAGIVISLIGWLALSLAPLLLSIRRWRRRWRALPPR